MWKAIDKKTQHLSREDKNLIKTAYAIAEEAHRGQKRATGEAYFTHPVAATLKLLELRPDAATIAASLLHDVLEESNVAPSDLTSSVGKEVTTLVEGLTKLDRVKYKSAARQTESVRKMFLAFAEDIRVVLIKLADRLHNMQTIKALPKEKQLRIAQETLEIYAPLAYRLGIGDWKGELEDLAFPVVLPDEYAWVRSETKKRMPGRKEFLKGVSKIMESELKKNNIVPIAIDFRAKHAYSLWKKLLQNDLDFDRITDLAAIRIIVSSIEECYETLGIVHSLWKPMPGRIKDYIAMPKPNGYRSLHTTVFCIGERVTEFQIRTRAMHEEAEYGIAAHWAYTEADKPKRGIVADKKKLDWINKLQEWQKEYKSGSGEDFIEALKIDFFKNRIFVLTPRGEVIDLPEGSTPIDFAYHIHTYIGDHLAGAKVNGKMVPFSYTLISGDTVEVLAKKGSGPKPDWLQFARSSLARSHIRSSLKKRGIEVPKARTKFAKTFETTVQIYRKTRIGLIKDISTILSKEKIDIIKAEAESKNQDKPFIVLGLRVPRKCDTKKVFGRIERLRGVQRVEIIQ